MGTGAEVRFDRTPVGFPLTAILLTSAVVVIFLIVAFFAKRVVHAVEDIGESYTALYKQQHREVMEALQSETRKAIADTKAMVMEHTELERILRVLAARAAEDDAVEEKRAAEDDLEKQTARVLLDIDEPES